MNWRVHLITFFVFLFAIGTIRLIWDNPQVILYIILGMIGLLAYGAIYIIVKSRMERRK